MHKLPHLFKSRHGIWYVRYQRDGHEVKRSLQTKDWHLARLLGLQFNLSLAMTFRKLDVVFPGGIRIENINSESDHDRFLRLIQEDSFQLLLKATQRTPPAPNGGAPERPSFTPVAPAAPVHRSKLLSEVVPLYVAEKGLTNTKKTLDEKQANYGDFMSWFGDLDINLYTNDQALAFKNRLIGTKQSALRINKRLSFMKDLFAYAINNRLYFDKNPFETTSIPKTSKLRKQVESYVQFSQDELKLIFSPVGYAEFMNKPDYFWIPFIGLFSGARIEEIASLRIDQIKQDGNIWFIELEKGKNENSVRKIPLHKELVNSKFLTYVDSVRKSSNDQKSMLFPHLKPSKNGYSKNCSRRFALYLDKLGIKDTRKVFHSFRSTFINKLTDMNCHPAILMGIVGHYSQAAIDLSSTHFTTYQQNKTVTVLKEAIDKLDYQIDFQF